MTGNVTRHHLSSNAGCDWVHRWVILLFHTPLPCLCTSSTWMFTFTKLHLLHLLFKLWFRKLFFLSSVCTYTTSSVSYSKEDAVVEVVASSELFSESWGLFYLREASVHVLRNSPTSEQNMTYVTLDVMYLTSNTDVTGCESKCLDWQWSRGCELIQTQQQVDCYSAPETVSRVQTTTQN